MDLPPQYDADAWDEESRHENVEDDRDELFPSQPDTSSDGNGPSAVDGVASNTSGASTSINLASGTSSSSYHCPGCRCQDTLDSASSSTASPLGESSESTSTASRSRNDECLVCYDSLSAQDELVWCCPECRIGICINCWDGYVARKVQEGRDVTCMHCRAIIDDEAED